MSQAAIDALMKSAGWDLAWISVLIAVALMALRGGGDGDAEDAGDAD